MWLGSESATGYTAAIGGIRVVVGEEVSDPDVVGVVVVVVGSGGAGEAERGVGGAVGMGVLVGSAMMIDDAAGRMEVGSTTTVL